MTSEYGTVTVQGEYDVVIVGAGTAGAAAAGLCAERGMRVLCVDRRPLEEAGARWVNGVSASAFVDAGIEPPRAPELLGDHDAGFHLVAGWGPRKLVIRDHGVLEVDMRHLVARLHARARDASADVVGEIRIGSVDGHTVHTDRGSVRAGFIVDASGLSGARLLGQARVPSEHICAAAQEVRRVTDSGAARAFFERHQVPVGDALCFTGVAGGYSIVNVRIEGEHVAILTGSIPALGHPSGKALLDGFVAEQPWIGDTIFGGARTVPLRRPRDTLANDRIALIGDAACQVFSAHGSGIGAGMIAARTLADALSEGRGPIGYARTWMRRYGGVFAAYDLFRRLSQTLTSEQIEKMMASGLMDADMVRAGLRQTLPKLALPTVPHKLAALGQQPGLGLRLMGTVARMPALLALYARYPERSANLPRWSRAVARVFGEAADQAFAQE